MEEKLRLRIETAHGEKFLTTESRDVRMEDFKMRIKEYLMETFGRDVDVTHCKDEEGYIYINRVLLGDVFRDKDIVHVEYMDVPGRGIKKKTPGPMSIGKTHPRPPRQKRARILSPINPAAQEKTASHEEQTGSNLCEDSNASSYLNALNIPVASSQETCDWKAMDDANIKLPEAMAFVSNPKNAAMTELNVSPTTDASLGQEERNDYEYMLKQSIKKTKALKKETSKRGSADPLTFVPLDSIKKKGSEDAELEDLL